MVIPFSKQFLVFSWQCVPSPTRPQAPRGQSTCLCLTPGFAYNRHLKTLFASWLIGLKIIPITFLVGTKMQLTHIKHSLSCTSSSFSTFKLQRNALWENTWQFRWEKGNDEIDPSQVDHSEDRTTYHEFSSPSAPSALLGLLAFLIIRDNSTR